MPKSGWGGERTSGSRRGRWSTEEIARFKDLYGLKDDHAIARELGRTVPSVRNMARQLYDREPHDGPWSAEDVDALKRYLGASSVETIARILGRSKEDVQSRIAELARVKRTGEWSADEIGEFKRVFGTRTDEDLAIVFGRRLQDIRRQAKALCLSKDKAFLRRLRGGREATRMPRWTGAELDLLRDIYPRCSNLEIAQKLHRSVKSVVSKAHHLGLKKDPVRLQEMGRENVSLRYRRREG